MYQDISNMLNTVKQLMYIFKRVIFILIPSIFLGSCSKGDSFNDEYIGMIENYDSAVLKVHNKELCLGEIDKRNEAQKDFSFIIENAGDSILVIEKVDVSCSCIQVSRFPSLLEVGKSDVISGKIDLKNQIGHIRKSIFVNYDDSCLVVLKITADVID